MSLKICETSWFKVLKDNDSNIKPHGKWLNISFNRKRDHFAVATSTGLLVYKCSGKAKLIYYHDFSKNYNFSHGLAVATMSNTGRGIIIANRETTFSEKISVFDCKARSSLFTQSVDKPVINILILKPDIWVLVMEDEVQVWTIGNSFQKFIIKSTLKNPKGLCDIRIEGDSLVLAFLGSDSKPGRVQLCNYSVVTQYAKTTLKPLDSSVMIIQAHKSQIVSFELNNTGSQLVTASESGRLIKVWCTKTLKQLHLFRRGRFSAELFNVCFSSDSKLIACSSNTGSVHVFANIDGNNSYWGVKSPACYSGDIELIKYPSVVAFSHENNDLLKVVNANGILMYLQVIHKENSEEVVALKKLNQSVLEM